ncbi:MAG: S8 family peptidase [Prevotella sp.]|jgi:subtilisin family serine protease
MNLRFFLLILFIISSSTSGWSQVWQKMSPFVRQAALEAKTPVILRSPAVRQKAMRQGVLTAFVKMSGDREQTLVRYGCQELGRFGSVSIVAIPLSRLSEFSMDSHVSRIESGPRATALMDSTRMQVDALPVYSGTELPEAFDGKGVVVGVMDIGFDLLHPNFYSSDMSHYRIGALWDQLSTDTIGSSLYVGRDYVGEASLKALGCSRDGYIQSHGTHTTGIAAGSGYDSNYRGMAPESDICLVCNATSDDAELIDSADYYKYTYATDALGFKYIFDYAQSLGKPCVINFSEGSMQDFHGYDNLYYEMLDSLTGPGRIIVASAGNSGYIPRHSHKPANRQRAGAAFANADSNHGYFTVKGDGEYRIRLTFSSNGTNIQRSYSVDSLLATADSTLRDSVEINQEKIMIVATAYPSSYNADDRCMDFSFSTTRETFGISTRMAVSMEGNANVDLFANNGYLQSLNDGLTDNFDMDYSIHSPGSAPSVICVGANSYRTSFVNYEGDTMNYPNGTNGELALYSSKGPTYDERLKPDIVAPGTNIISSYSSFYWENDRPKGDSASVTKLFDYDGRTYLWAANTGTSMSSPVVAGAIALWLQAKPDLTPEQVIDIFAHTSTPIESGLTYPNNSYGYGQIDVYKGLLYILGTLGIQEISDHHPSKVTLRAVDEGVEIIFATPLSRPSTVRIYTTSGQLVATHQITGDTTLSLPHGLSIVQVDGPDAATTGSVIIRH